jgi:hypothetical protein
VGWLPALVWLTTILFSASALAEDKKEKEPGKPEPPRITVTLPLAVTMGVTNHIRIRGADLTNVTALRFTNGNTGAGIEIKAATKVDLPKDADAKKLGDTQVEVDLTFPANAVAATNYFIVVSPAGQSQTQPLILLPAGILLPEKEPNGGFRQAQTVVPGKTIQGVIKEAGDVDVFRFEGRAGAWVRGEVYAARGGAALDALLTLYDADGHSLAVNDDMEGRTDALLRAKLPADGTYFLSLIDAQDKGGPTYVYLLSIDFGH